MTKQQTFLNSVEQSFQRAIGRRLNEKEQKYAKKLFFRRYTLENAVGELLARG